MARRLLPALCGTAGLAAVAALRCVCDADAASARCLGRSFGAACWFQTRFHLPCPDCGLTRAVIVAAHGRFALAARIAPAGPVFVAATLWCAAALMLWGTVRAWGPAHWQRPVERSARRSILGAAYASVLAWAGGWLWALAQSWPGR